MKATFSSGIEEEYQTVDLETWDLWSHIQAKILEKGQLTLQERVKAEMHQSVVEVGTGVCKNIKEAKAEVKMLRRDIIRLAREKGVKLASGATHPFGGWRGVEIHLHPRLRNNVGGLDEVGAGQPAFFLVAPVVDGE